jgi:hypothetical protein
VDLVPCFGVICCLAAGVQSVAAFDVPGKLELVDGGPDTTPVDQMMVSIHSLDGPVGVNGQPDSRGHFVLKDVRPGRYSLGLSFPGRIRTFARGTQELNRWDFELKAGGTAPLRIVVSVKTSDLIVDVQGLPHPVASGPFAALLAPADPQLALDHACFTNALSAARTEFPFTVPGKYLLFITDARFQTELALNARLREALRDRATAVEVLENGPTNVSAFYIDRFTVQQAIRDVRTLQVKPASPP